MAIDKSVLAQLSTSSGIDAMLGRFGYLGDADDVLQRAGITRAQLRAVESDDEVSAALETRRDAACNVPWRIESDDPDVAEFVTAALRPVVMGLMECAWSAVPFGLSVQEVIYSEPSDPTNTTPGKIGISRIVDIPFEMAMIQPDGWFGWRESLQPFDKRKFFACVRNQTLRKPMGEAMLSRLYWPWFFRSNGWKFWVKYLERASIPFLHAKTDGDRQVAVNAIKLAVQDAAIATGTDDSITAISSAGGGTAAFERFEEAIVRRYHRTILGQTLTSGTDGGSGNRALGQVHDSVREEKKRADCRMITRHIQNIVTMLLMLNGIAVQARFVMEDGSGLEAARAERDKILTDAGMVKFTPDYIRDKYGLLDTDFTVPADAAPSTPTPQAFSFAAGGPKYSQGQQVIEDQAAAALLSMPDPIEAKAIAGAIRAARSVDDLEHRLQMLLKGKPDAEFAATLERAQFAAQVMGYAHAKEGK